MNSFLVEQIGGSPPPSLSLSLSFISKPGPGDDAWNQESKGQKLKSQDETSLKQK